MWFSKHCSVILLVILQIIYTEWFISFQTANNSKQVVYWQWLWCQRNLGINRGRKYFDILYEWNSWLKNKVHLCTCLKLTKISMCKHGIGSYMCSKEKLLFKWYMKFKRKWWASVTLLDTWCNFTLSASFICDMQCHEYKLDITREFKSPVSCFLPSLHSTLQNNFSVGNTGSWYRFS